jgi:hypothetical protein
MKNDLTGLVILSAAKDLTREREVSQIRSPDPSLRCALFRMTERRGPLPYDGFVNSRLRGNDKLREGAYE